MDRRIVAGAVIVLLVVVGGVFLVIALNTGESDDSGAPAPSLAPRSLVAATVAAT